jgi:glycosyltransferase involved in cell wall biosynthesis
MAARGTPTVVVLSDFASVNGGAAQVAVLGARALAARGCRVVFVAGGGPVAPALAAEGVKVRHLGMRPVWDRNRLAAAGSAVWNLRAGAELARLLATLDPAATVVHAHQWTKSLSPSVFAAALGRGFPLVVTLHDYFACCPNGLFFLFGEQASCPHRPLSAACALAACDRDGRAHKLVRLARQVATRAQLEHARSGRGRLTFVHVSGFARSRAQAHLPRDAAHLVVPNPCLVERRPPARPGAGSGFAFIGRFTAEKGTAVLAQALRGSGAHLTALGEGPLAGALREASPLVTLLPWGEPAAVLDLLDRSRALLFPSLWAETQGLVACEALARGVPVVASRATGAADLVERTGGGILVPPGEAAALAGAIAQLEDPAAAARLGALAYDGYWAAPLTVERHADALLDAYAGALDRAAARVPPRPSPLRAAAG